MVVIECTVARLCQCWHVDAGVYLNRGAKVYVLQIPVEPRELLPTYVNHVSLYKSNSLTDLLAQSAQNDNAHRVCHAIAVPRGELALSYIAS